jgi:hypothetical protein
MFAVLEDQYFDAAPMTLADEHRVWHTIHGWNVACPLDCFDPYYDEPMTLAEEIAVDVAERGIPCGNCKDRHPAVSAVRKCHARRR